MRTDLDGILLSPSDLSNHVACRHQTALDLAAARGRLAPPTYHDPSLEVLQERGLRHKTAYLDHLAAQGLAMEYVAGDPAATGPATDLSADDAAARTLALMRQGADAIVQAGLADGLWRGRADVLLKVATPSALGDWSYEVVDTKLARETKGGTILQVCCYSDLVGRVQGCMPEHMHVIAPRRGFEPETFRTNDYLAYCRYAYGSLTQAVGPIGGSKASTYPEPVEHCQVCRWWQVCDQRRRSDDHLLLVAGISTLQRRELETQGVTTLAGLARLPLPLARPRRGSREALERVREQARVQLEGRERGTPGWSTSSATRSSRMGSPRTTLGGP